MALFVLLRSVPEFTSVLTGGKVSGAAPPPATPSNVVDLILQAGTTRYVRFSRDLPVGVTVDIASQLCRH